MAKLVAIYTKPEDTDDFEQKYFETHIPLIEKVPGLQDTTITRFTRAIAGGDDLYMMAEMHFEDQDALKAAMKSEEMAAAGENLEGFASGLYMLLFAEEDE